MAQAGPDIKYRESLERWLADKPLEWAQTIAARAALRVLPLVERTLGTPDERYSLSQQKGLILAACRANFVLWAGRKYQIQDTSSTASAAIGLIAARKASATAWIDTAASAAAEAATHALDVTASSPASAAGSSASAAALSAEEAAALSSALGSSDGSSAYAAGIAASNEVWRSITDDAKWVEARREGDSFPLQATALMEQPLWLSDVRGDPEYRANFPPWVRTPFDRMANDPALKKAGFDHWIEWYRAILPNSRGGKPRSAFGEAADITIATAPDEFWNLDLDEVMTDIGRVVRGEPTEHLERLRKQAEQPSDNSKAPEVSPEASTERHPETSTNLLPDAPDAKVDHLGRAPLAFVLAGRLNRIWDIMNPPIHRKGWFWRTLVEPRDWDDGLRPGFVVHIDAPWGGGKTNFAGFLTRILNPYRHAGEQPDWMTKLPLDEEAYWPRKHRRGWHIVEFNAWRHQHVNPPWWVFSQSIRRQCLAATLHERNEQWGKLPRPVWPHIYEGPITRRWLWLKYNERELLWRMWSPSMVSPLILAGLVFLLIFGFFQADLLTLGGKDPVVGEGIGPIPTVALTLLLGGGASVWAVFRLFTQTLFPGTPDAARNYSLGSGDPLDRFRKHFATTMRQFGRPILVVVDDLDRCEPSYVVELIRGMQTILVSPRVIFVLLGDRDWIERAFAESHKVMKDIDVGPEHEFGGRFVEKAIQFSLVLPDIEEETRLGYVRRLLKLDDAPANAGFAANGESGEAATDLRHNMESVIQTEDYAEREQAAAELRRSGRFETLGDRQAEQLKRDLSISLSLRAAADSSAERATSHMIESLVPLLPANPRQIKRIVNAVSLMTEAARLARDIEPGSEDWQVMARWVVLMLEWPKTWYTLSHHPQIADMALGSKRSARNSSPRGAKEIVASVKANRTVMGLLDFSDPDKGWKRRKITSEEIAWLKFLMPPTSGRLLEPSTSAGLSATAAYVSVGHKQILSASVSILFRHFVHTPSRPPLACQPSPPRGGRSAFMPGFANH